MRLLLLPLILALSLPSIANAAKIHIRDDAGDLGFMREVDAIEVDRTYTFNRNTWHPQRKQYTTNFPGAKTGVKLRGMTEECLDAPGNPKPNFCANRPDDPECGEPQVGAIRGSFPGGITLPDAPISVVTLGLRHPGKVSANQPYIWDFPGGPNGSPDNFVTGPIWGCGYWGDDGFAMTFDSPVTAIGFDVVFLKDADRNCTTGDRVHNQFWGEDGVSSSAYLVGHRDMVVGGPEMTQDAGNTNYCYQSFFWESDAPIKAWTTWPENGPGVWWDTVYVGTANSGPTSTPTATTTPTAIPTATPTPDPTLQQCLDACFEQHGP